MCMFESGWLLVCVGSGCGGILLMCLIVISGCVVMVMFCGCVFYFLNVCVVVMIMFVCVVVFLNVLVCYWFNVVVIVVWLYVQLSSFSILLW